MEEEKVGIVAICVAAVSVITLLVLLHQIGSTFKYAYVKHKNAPAEPCSIDMLGPDVTVNCNPPLVSLIDMVDYRVGLVKGDAGYFHSSKYGNFCFDYASGTSLECTVSVSFELNGEVITNTHHIPKKDWGATLPNITSDKK